MNTGKPNRRTFLTYSALLGVSMLTSSSPLFAETAKKRNLSFSTLGCPDWTMNEILHFASNNGYHGIEFRGVKRQIDLTKVPEFSSPELIRATKALIKEHGLKIVDLGSSAVLHEADPVKNTANLDEAKKYIDLAQELGCPYIRVFPNKIPAGEDKNRTISRITDGMQTLGTFAKNSGVSVLLESHGDLVYTKDLLEIMKGCAGPNTAMIWDIFNMWVVTGESPASVYNQLSPYIKHVHVKDGIKTNNQLSYALLGKGAGPIKEAVGLLDKGGYKGFYSFEWEKLWHPEIEEPNVAFAHYPGEINTYFSK